MIPIVLLVSFPNFVQDNAGGQEVTVSGEPIGATHWNGIGTPEESWTLNHEPIGRGTVATVATKAPPQIKTIVDQRAPPTANHHIIVSIPDRKLYLMEKGKIIRQYNALLGDANQPTPTGDFRIIEHIRLNDVVLGKAWMGFREDSDTYYGIHGLGPEHDETATSGCVALKNDDVIDLFRRVSEGDAVTITGTRGPSPKSFLEAVSLVFGTGIETVTEIALGFLVPH